MRRRRGLVAAAAVVVAVVGAVAFIEAREPARPERAYGAEEAGDPPPYPFLEPDPGPVERRFKQQKLNLNLDGTPFAEVLGVLKDLTSVPVELDPSVAAAIGTATVTLKVRDITVERALLLVLASCPVDVLPCFERTKVLVLPASRVPPRPLWQRVSTEEIFKGWRGGELEPTWVHEYKKRLATQRLTFNFSATPLSEAVQFFQDFTSLNVAVDKVVDTEATKLDLVLRGVLAEEALAAVCSAAGLEARFKNEAIYLTERRPRSALLDRKVTLDLRGAKAPDLLVALERQGVPVLASREAWEGRGTFSIFLDAVPVESAVAAIHSATALRVALVEEPEELLALGGSVPSVVKALDAKVTAPFPGVKRQLAQRRAELCEAVAARDDLRRGGPRVALLDAERKVHEQVEAIRELTNNAQAFDESPERLRRADLEVAQKQQSSSAKFEQRQAKKLVAGRALLVAGAKLVPSKWGGLEPEKVDASPAPAR